MAAAAFFGAAPAGAGDQDLAHDPRRHAEEVRAVLEIGQILGDELQVGFMNEGGRLQGDTGTFAPHAADGESFQFCVDDGSQGVQRLFVAAAALPEKDGEVASLQSGSSVRTNHSATGGVPVLAYREKQPQASEAG